MSPPPPLPTPVITDPPNVPSDLGAVAQAIENQAVGAYNGYNTTNTPSATSLETRTTAIDAQPGGTAAALDTRITTLNNAINTWTAGTPSNNLSTQVTRTAAFGAQQDSQDATMSSLNSSLNTYEPQINTLISQRPPGLLYSYIYSFNLDITASTFIIYQTHNFISNHWYRVSFTGTAQSTVGNVNQSISAQWVISAGSSPSMSGGLAGVSNTPLGMTSNAMPFACFGMVSGYSGTYTIALSANVASPGSRGARLVNFCPFLMEDLGYRYY